MRACKRDRDRGVLEHVGPRAGEEAGELAAAGFSDGKDGRLNEDGVGR